MVAYFGRKLADSAGAIAGVRDQRDGFQSIHGCQDLRAEGQPGPIPPPGRTHPRYARDISPTRPVRRALPRPRHQSIDTSFGWRTPTIAVVSVTSPAEP